MGTGVAGVVVGTPAVGTVTDVVGVAAAGAMPAGAVVTGAVVTGAVVTGAVVTGAAGAGAVVVGAVTDVVGVAAAGAVPVGTGARLIGVVAVAATGAASPPPQAVTINAAAHTAVNTKYFLFMVTPITVKKLVGHGRFAKAEEKMTLPLQCNKFHYKLLKYVTADVHLGNPPTRGGKALN